MEIKKNPNPNLSPAPNGPCGKYKLDFGLSGAQSRTEFLARLLNENPQLSAQLTQNDFDLFVDYICCGIGAEESKNPKPKSSVQKKEIFLENKNRPKPKEESLDALLETPTFNEGTSFNRRNIRYKIPKPNFSRERIRAKGQAAAFQDLWNQIDQLESLVGVQKKHQSDPNPNWTIFESQNPAPSPHQTYVARKLLLDLRRTQYTLDDFFNP